MRAKQELIWPFWIRRNFFLLAKCNHVFSCPTNSKMAFDLQRGICLALVTTPAQNFSSSFMWAVRSSSVFPSKCETLLIYLETNGHCQREIQPALTYGGLWSWSGWFECVCVLFLFTHMQKMCMRSLFFLLFFLLLFFFLFYHVATDVIFANSEVEELLVSLRRNNQQYLLLSHFHTFNIFTHNGNHERGFHIKVFRIVNSVRSIGKIMYIIYSKQRFPRDYCDQDVHLVIYMLQFLSPLLKTLMKTSKEMLIK